MRVTKSISILMSCLVFLNIVSAAYSNEQGTTPPKVKQVSAGRVDSNNVKNLFLKPAGSDPNISILWKKDIVQGDRKIESYTIKVDENKSIVRIIGVSYISKPKQKPRVKSPELFEYRLNLNDNTSDLKTLMAMDEGDIAITLPNAVLDSQLIDSNIVMLRQVYKSENFQEITIGRDWQVKTREIPGLTRNSVSTLGACRDLKGDMFLCGNSGFIRKVRSDGNVAWDANYKSNKGEDVAFGAAFSESINSLVVFGSSFESESKFTTKNSSLWLANLDPDGNFKANIQFEGVANFGKTPLFCLSKSDNPIVIYDNDTKIGSCKINVSRFSKDLKTKDWTTQIFDGNDMMMSQMFLTELENNCTLATLSTFGTRSERDSNLYFYILDNNGSIINKAIFNGIVNLGFAVTVFKDKIFLVTNWTYQQGGSIENAKLICFKIKPGQN